MGELGMMYGHYYGKYQRGEWLPEFARCECGRESLEFIKNKLTGEVIGCTECMVTTPSGDEQYMVDVDGATYLKCPCCDELCDTLYATKSMPWYVDGCENCLEWIDSFNTEE